MTTFFASLFVFGLLIFVHEFGHYIVAKRSGIKVLELAIGFGPKLIGWTRGETDYSLRVIPLGGFCRMLGENPEESDLPGSFLQKPLSHRAATIAAGPIMNFALALLLLVGVYYFYSGITREGSTAIGRLEQGKPAAGAGMQTGDEITAIDGVPVNSWQELVSLIENRPGEELTITILRHGRVEEIMVTPVEDPESGRGIIGIYPEVQRSFPNSVKLAFQHIQFILTVLYQTVTGQLPLDITGTVGIIIIVGQVAETGFVNLLLLTAVMSISLGIINLLPIPALDGGRLLFLFIEGVRGKPMDPEKEGFIHFIGFALLIVLILFITYKDLIRWEIIR